MKYVLGIDIGTTNLKVLLVDLNGRELFSSSKRNKVMDSRRSGWAEFSPNFIYNEIAQLIRDAVDHVDRSDSIKALSISSMGETGVLIDGGGKCVYPAIAWYDNRTIPQMKWWQARDYEDMDRYQITGLPLSTSYGLLKLMWLQKNCTDSFQNGRCWLPIGDYIAYRLCGVASTDQTSAWRTMAFDIHRLNWSEKILKTAGVDSSLMPPVVPSGTALGTVHKVAAEETRLDTGCIVVSGGMDAICGMVAVGAIKPGITLDIIGTSEIVLTTVKKDKLSTAIQGAAIDVGPHILPEHYVAFGSMTASGSVVEWFARLLSEKRESLNINAILEELISETTQFENYESPVICLPHFNGNRTPHNDRFSRGSILGLSLETTRKDIYIGILTGLCCESRLVTNSLYKAFDMFPEKVWVSGGASKMNFGWK